MTGIEPAYSAREAISMPERVGEYALFPLSVGRPKYPLRLRFQSG